MLRKKRGKSLATLRERVERQRSVTSSANHGTESNSLEGLNLERGDSSYKTRAVEQLDNQVSTLHQDVAALSVEVRGNIFYFSFHSCSSFLLHSICIHFDFDYSVMMEMSYSEYCYSKVK